MTSHKMSSPRVRRFLTSLLALSVALPAFAQVANNPASTPEAPAKPAAKVEEAPKTEKTDDKGVLQLSPFVVTTTKDQGYYAENTLAGSRLRMNVSDLGASITVVTKQQMEDTGSLDINDVFRYEANTEGSSTYTPSVQSLRSDGVVDVNAGFTEGGNTRAQTNATANRVRGLGVPSSSNNYYPSIAAVPFDAYNVQSIEISRGPNSMIFGMGSPAGIVNQSTAQAVIGRDAASVSLRTDNYGSQRASLTFNKSLIDDKLAIYGAYLIDNKEFARKPSYDDTRRLYAAITAKPFAKTTIRATFEDYENHNRRPNSLTPRDGVSEWRAAGRPVYDSTSGMVTILDSGKKVGPLVQTADNPNIAQVRAYIEALPTYNPAKWTSAARTAYRHDGVNAVNIFGDGLFTNTASALFTPGIAFANTGRPVMQIADGQLVSWTATPGTYRAVYGTSTDPSANAPLIPSNATIYANPQDAQVTGRRWAQSGFWTQTQGKMHIGNYRYPGVTDQSIYDWENVNILQMNFGHDKNKTYNVELEQEILPNLNLSAGWFRQDYNSNANYTVSQLNVATLFVDNNVYQIDGSPNPYFGQPYVLDFDPDRFLRTEKNDSRRAMLAYTPDFTRNEGWTRWLGRHQLVGLYSSNQRLSSLKRDRWFFTDGNEGSTIRWLKNPNNTAAGAPTGYNHENTSVQRWFYLGDQGSQPYGNVTTTSGTFDHESVTGAVRAYNYGTHAWEGINMTQGWVTHNASTGRSFNQVDSKSIGLTSYLFNERIISTVGFRNDRSKSRNTTTGSYTTPDGVVVPALTNQQKWVNGYYQTEEVFNRWGNYDNVEGDTKTIGGVFRPFKNWAGIDRRANDGSAFWEFVRSFGFSYNQSDNFNPPSGVRLDAFGNPLPKPTGEGKDFGFQFSLFDNKLFARVNFFESSNDYETGAPGTSLSRLTLNHDRDTFRNWARTIALINTGRDPRVDKWDEGLTPAEEDAVQAATSTIYGLEYDYYDFGVSSTQSAVAKGTEIQLTYNPTRAWTMKLTAGEQETVYSNVLKEFDDWYDYRAEVWDNATASQYLLPQYASFATYTTAGGRAVNLTKFWDSYGYVGSRINPDNSDGVRTARIHYDTVVGGFYNLARDLEGQVAPTQRKYRASFLTNYSIQEGRFSGVGLGGSVRWESKAALGYLGKSSGARTDPTFLDVSDVTKPVYDSGHYYTDVWISYKRKVFNDRVNMKVQLNVVNALENGELRPTSVDYAGNINAYRIIDPRQFILQTTFDF